MQNFRRENRIHFKWESPRSHRHPSLQLWVTVKMKIQDLVWKYLQSLLGSKNTINLININKFTTPLIPQCIAWCLLASLLKRAILSELPLLRFLTPKERTKLHTPIGHVQCISSRRAPRLSGQSIFGGVFSKLFWGLRNKRNFKKL